MSGPRSCPAFFEWRWIASARPRVKYGGLTGPWFVVYHGQIADDSEVPVEVCAPISLAQEGSTAAAMRREPAHREAYVRITKAQVTFPEIQSVYAGLDRWIRSQRLEIADAPREVYFPTSFLPARATKSVTSRSRFVDGRKVEWIRC